MPTRIDTPYPFPHHQADTREARYAYIDHDEQCAVCLGIVGPCSDGQRLWNAYKELRQRDRLRRNA